MKRSTVGLCVAVLGCAVAVVACAGASRPGTKASPSKTADRPSVDALIAGMTLEEKAGQLFLVGGFGTYLSDDAPAFRGFLSSVTRDHVGGLLWLKSNVYETAFLNARLQKASKLPLLVSADLEAGLGMRFEEAIWGPSAMALAAAGDPGLAERRARATAVEARALGINQVYAPVADVNVNPDNPIINVRSFSEDVSEVSRFVVAYVKGLQSGGVVATLKHFPGHGDTAVDSHRSLPVLPFDRKRLDDVELAPFRAGIAAGARSVMVSHLAVPALDATPAPPLAAAARNMVYTSDVKEVEDKGSMPATLSAPIVTGLLRKELGFTGTIVTDAMNMGGIAAHFDAGEAAVRALLAGCDEVLFSADPQLASRAVVDAVRSGRLPESRLDESVRRVLADKLWLGLFESRSPDPARIAGIVSSQAHREIEEEVARRSLTLLREEPGLLPLSPGKKIASLVITDETVVPTLGLALGAELSRVAGSLRTVRLDPRSPASEVEDALAAARDADVVLVGLFVRPRGGAGKLAIPDAGKQAIEGLLALDKPVVTVSFGSPYLLRDYPQWKTYLCAYGIQDVCQRAVVRSLFGEAGFEGKLPVTLPGLYPRGSGIYRAAGRAGVATGRGGDADRR